ncbi:MAG: methionyl-tRNA formyltransferase [Phycisphaerae bacterium]|jgi:methionyl-tRNA formyltransferase
MRIAYIGSGRFGLVCLESLRDSKHGIEFILTQPSRAAGRGKKTTPTPVAQWAQTNQIPCLETDDSSQPGVIQKVRDINPDLILVIAFGQKLSDELIELAPLGMINVHSSLLPKYRGAAPINWAIIKGETKTGVSIATVTSNWDAGQILAQTETKIEPDENAEQLGNRLSQIAAPLLLDVLEKIENGTAEYAKQDAEKVTRAPKLKKTDGYIDFTRSAQEVHNLVRGLYPWPGVNAIYQSKTSGKTSRTMLIETRVINASDTKELSAATFDKDLNLACGSGILKIVKIKPAGKNVIPFEDFVNGYRIKPQDKLVKIEDET